MRHPECANKSDQIVCQDKVEPSCEISNKTNKKAERASKRAKQDKTFFVLNVNMYCENALLL